MKWFRLDVSVLASDDISEDEVERSVRALLRGLKPMDDQVTFGMVTIHDVEEEKD